MLGRSYSIAVCKDKRKKGAGEIYPLLVFHFKNLNFP